MYLAIVVLLMAVLPLGSVLIEHAVNGMGMLELVGKWFVFWPVGVRLLLAGMRQIFTPAFTAKTIFKIEDPSVFHIVQELGFGNTAIGLLGILTLFAPDWIIPAAITGAIFYGLAGIGHILSKERNGMKTIAMVSDLAISALLAIFLLLSLSSA